MIPQTYRQQYRNARLGQISADTLEAIAATIALQSRQDHDKTGDRYRQARDFVEFLKPQKPKKEYKIFRQKPESVRAIMVDLWLELNAEDESAEPEAVEDMMVEFDQIWADR